MSFRLLIAPLALVLALLAPGAGLRAASPPEPSIVSRSQWKAKPAKTENMLRHSVPIKGIVIHNTETPQSAWRRKTTDQKVRDVQAFHQTRPHLYRPEMKGKTWGDFAYHYYIDVGGEIAKGREDQYQGDSGTRYEMNGLLLVVLEGKFDIEQPTAEQLASLDRLVAWLADKHGLKPDNLSVHNDHAPTTCPGKNLKSYIPTLKRKLAEAQAGAPPRR